MLHSLRLWTIVMLGTGGLFTGGIVWYAWERVWIWRRMTPAEYAEDFRRSLRKADPAMPILVVTCGAAASMFASLTSGPARTIAFAGIGLLAAILVSSIVIAEPINNQFRRHAAGVLPPGTERLRRLWRRFHLVRTGLALAAFACLTTAASYA